MKINKPDFIAAIIVLGISAVLLFETSQLHGSNVSNELGPKFFPYICLILTVIASLVLLVKSLFQKEEKKGGDKKDSSMKEAMIFYALIFLAIIIVYICGFLVGMIIGSIIVLWWTKWQPLKAALFSAISVGVIYIIFEKMLLVPLPKGMLF
jgi:putative tricarboxylic transport membrane protein